MSASASSAPTLGRSMTRTRFLIPKLIGFLALLCAALWFVVNYPLQYIFHYNEGHFTNPGTGAANYWRDRFWLLAHFGGGILALLVGPWQFWTGFRARYVNLHRWTGRLFLFGVALGCVGATRLLINTTFGWGFGTSIASLAIAWAVTTGIAYYAILKGQVSLHKVWMVRAYVVTFAFVTFRVLHDYGPTSRLQPEQDRAINAGWACWAIPLLFTIAMQELLAIRKQARARLP